MSSPSISRPEAIDRFTRGLPAVSATKLVAGMQKVTSAVMTHGAVVVTRHDEPAMVLMSIDRYLALEQAAEPDLDALTQQFDDMFARMQGNEAAEAMESAFAMTPAELGKAAVRAAGGGKSAKR
ncbi:Antitoxin Phd_YefM, type II toxin-antitoxin system [Variovorax sp. HW608]|uniref:prevent-host-death family protein n=1 Tax=Variovorax sp. HW608 TaxID=1034889 RepID=UPI00081FFFEB|nr:prevent-host-death family protein [Variovorax sp. HW608]SCK31461.1 Antitoxin Phd_YefM, type II toxin-antitoxin system [Variovorax sp. HW608]